jgi:probable rRNA maturation factor
MIRIQHEGFPSAGKKLPALLKRIAGRLGIEGEVTIRLAGEEEVRSLNREYRGLDRATDVLSFPVGERLPDGFYAGDIIICVPVAQVQARRHSQSLERELLLLMTHGLLHLKGLDHETDRGEMLALQRRLLAEFAKELP